MDSATIESQIKGLLGLNLGLGGPGSTPVGSLPTPGITSTPAPSTSAPGSYPGRRNSSRDHDKPETKEESPSKVIPDSYEEYPTIEALIQAEALKESRVEEYSPPEILKQHLDEHQRIRKSYLVVYLYNTAVNFLKKKPQKVRRQNWLCRLCEYHCDDLKVCLEHIENSRHKRLVKLKVIEETLKLIPSPTKLHLDGLSTLLTSTAANIGLTEEDVSKRLKIADQVNELLKPELPECNVRLCGSSLSGFGLKNSDVNLDMEMDSKDFKSNIVLLKALEALQNANLFREVKDDFATKHPSILLKTFEGHNVRLSLHNNNAFLTSQLLKDYAGLDSRVKQLGINFRHWASITGFDDEKNGTFPPHAFPILLIFFLQQLEQPVLPCIHEDFITQEENVKSYNPDYDKLKEWKSENTESIAQLWIQLFNFYGLNPVHVVSIRSTKIRTHENMGWKSKKLAIEDPFSPKRNLASAVLHSNIFSYIDVAFKSALLYFGTIQTCHGPVVTKILPDQDEEVEKDGIPEWTLESWLAAKGTQLTTKQLKIASSLVPKNMVSFSYDSENLLEGCVMVDFCSVCITEGHKAEACPCEIMPLIKPLPAQNKQYLQMLEQMFHRIKMRLLPTEEELRKRDLIMRDLNGFISRQFGNAVLTLFGSCANGFATHRSDLDISLTFSDKEFVEEIDTIKIIEELGKKIKRMVGVKNVQSITSAKVPIVKLWYDQLNVEADISLYNILARENTDMIRLYSQLDTRFATLGYIVKHFAKECDIGDASKQTLSSYAYMLMMIHFLQQISPPVLPVLQEMYEGEQPENIVEGWNAWYQKDKKKINWCSANKLSTAELWIKFLDFYAVEWNDEKLVVSIRQHNPLTKFEKMWNSKCIAIEDPFDLSHNLGSGVRRRMYLYIKRTFIIARNLFGNPKKNSYRRDYPEDVFFNRNLLTDGPKPVDRGCRMCGKIGHIIKECPQRRRACRLCKEVGHLAKNCPERNSVDAKQRSQSERNDSELDRITNWRDRSRSEATPAARDRTRSEASQVESDEGENGYYEESGEDGGAANSPFSTPGHPGNRFSKPRKISTSDSVGKQNRLRQLSTGDDRNNRTPPRGFGGPTTPQYKQGTPNNQRTNVFQSPPPLPPGSAGRMPPTRGMVAQTTVPPPPVGFPPRGMVGPDHPLPGRPLHGVLPPPPPQQQNHDNKLMQLLAQLQQGGTGGNNVGPGLGPQQQGQMPDLAQLLKGQGRPPPQHPQPQQMPIGGPLQNILQQPPPVPNRGVSPGKQPDPSQFPAALHHLLKLGATMPPMNKQPNQEEKFAPRSMHEKSATPAIDITALAARTGVSVGKKLPTAAINAEDLEKSMLGNCDKIGESERNRDDRDRTPVPQNQPPIGQIPSFGLAPGGSVGGQPSSKPPPGFDRGNSSPIMTGGGGLPTPFMDINQMNLLQHLHAQQAAFAAQQAAVSTASGGNPMMFPFLPSMGMGFQGMDPRFQHMPQVGGPMFGGMPGMFGPIMMGGGGEGAPHDLIMNQQRPIQDPFPPMNALPGLGPQPPLHMRGEGREGQHFSNRGSPQQGDIRRSPDMILPPARAENNSPDGSIQTAPSPLPTANSPMQAATPPPIMLGWGQNPLFPMPLLSGMGGGLGGPPPGMATPPRPFQGFGTGFSPFQAHPSGFQSSVLFPGDFQHPLAAQGPGGVGHHLGQEEQPISLDESGLPSSPPINIKDFDFDSLDHQ